MDTAKLLLKRTLKAIGYEICRADSKPPEIRFENFENLAAIYEHLFDQSISPDKIRYRLLTRLQGTPPSEAYFIVSALAQCNTLSGDVCEFGVAQGETSALIANEIRDTEKTLHLFDSFEGLPAPTAKDQLKDDIFELGSIEAYQGQMSCPEDWVIARLKAISFPSDRAIIHKGFIEDLIHSDTRLPARVSFAYVDFDFYEPLMVALKYLDGVMPVGGVMVVDDYDFFSTGAKAAVDEFVQGRPQAYDLTVPDVRYGHFAVLRKLI